MTNHEYLKIRGLDRNRIPLLYDRIADTLNGFVDHVKWQEKQEEELLSYVRENSHIPLLKAARKVFKVEQRGLLSRSRKRMYCEPKYAITYILRTKFADHYTYQRICDILGRANHTTALNWFNKACNFMDTDEQFQNKIKELIESFNDEVLKLQENAK